MSEDRIFLIATFGIMPMSQYCTELQHSALALSVIIVSVAVHCYAQCHYAEFRIFLQLC
jgi:hypothetical protein